MTIAMISEQEHIISLLCRIPRDNRWKGFLELMMEKNATMTTTPDEIITKLVKKKAVITRQNGLAPKGLTCAKKGGRGSRGGKVGKCPNRAKKEHKRDYKDDSKGKNVQKCTHCQRRGHITKNSLSEQRCDPPRATDAAPKALTETTSTLTTLTENYGKVDS
jgi:hypothetical protein